MTSAGALAEIPERSWGWACWGFSAAASLSSGRFICGDPSLPSGGSSFCFRNHVADAQLLWHSSVISILISSYVIRLLHYLPG